MALKTFRKIMKPVTLVVAIAMIGSGAWLTLKNLTDGSSSKGAQYAFELNGEKVTKVKVAREQNTFSGLQVAISSGRAPAWSSSTWFTII